MKWEYNDGGRSKYFKGKAGDCACRAIAIATERDYKEIYDLINEKAKSERTGKRKKGVSSAREGVYAKTVNKIMDELGFEWVSTMSIGSGCRVHLNESELPKGRIVARLSKHYVAVIDGVVNDTYDSTRGGNRCVYGYWKRKGA